MPVANNLLTSVILAPVVTILSALSLSTLQRLLDYINSIASNPQKCDTYLPIYLTNLLSFIYDINKYDVFMYVL